MPPPANTSKGSQTYDGSREVDEPTAPVDLTEVTRGDVAVQDAVRLGRLDGTSHIVHTTCQTSQLAAASGFGNMQLIAERTAIYGRPKQPICTHALPPCCHDLARAAALATGCDTMCDRPCMWPQINQLRLLKIPSLLGTRPTWATTARPSAAERCSTNGHSRMASQRTPWKLHKALPSSLMVLGASLKASKMSPWQGGAYSIKHPQRRTLTSVISNCHQQ